MKKIVLISTLAVIFFIAGYAQSQRNIEKKVTIEARDEIVIKTGNASITLKKDGTIQLNGKDINITGSGEVSVKASADVIIKGKKINDN